MRFIVQHPGPEQTVIARCEDKIGVGDGHEVERLGLHHTLAFSKSETAKRLFLHVIFMCHRRMPLWQRLGRPLIS